jgi:hypothetical protein
MAFRVGPHGVARRVESAPFPPLALVPGVYPRRQVCVAAGRCPSVSVSCDPNHFRHITFMAGSGQHPIVETGCCSLLGTQIGCACESASIGPDTLRVSFRKSHVCCVALSQSPSIALLHFGGYFSRQVGRRCIRVPLHKLRRI